MNIVERPETLCNQFDRHGNDFDAKENIVSYNSFGKTKTFFKPRSKNYWKNQSKK